MSCENCGGEVQHFSDENGTSGYLCADCHLVVIQSGGVQGWQVLDTRLFSETDE